MYKRNFIRKMLERFAADHQNQIALKLYNGQKIKEISYTGLTDRILSAVSYFKETGLSGRHVALLGTNSAEWIVAFLAIIASGNVVVPLNPELPEETILLQCTQADVSVVCGESGVISVFSGEYHCVSYDMFRGRLPVQLADIVCVNGDALTMLLFTSGTTGASKAVEITAANLESSMKSEDGVFSEPEINKIMTVLPMFHIAGIRGALAMLYRFKTLCIGRGIMYVFRDMPVLGPDYISLVPLMVDSLIKIMRRTSTSNLRTQYIGENLKRICVGGATVDPEHCRYLMEKGFVIDCGYALSETTGVGTWGTWDQNHFNTIGKVSNELQCRIVDGELLFKGPAVMKGYYKDAEATTMAIEDGWLHSGDLGFCDQEGYYYLTGRKKTLIVMSNGEKINPEEVERKFERCVAIIECQLWYHDKDSVLCLDVYTNNREAVQRAVEMYNEENLLSHQIRRIFYHDKPFEKSGSGKIMRKERR